jgi:hypothetical protein
MTYITPSPKSAWFALHGNEAQCLVCKFKDSCRFQCYPGLKHEDRPACFGKGL